MALKCAKMRLLLPDHARELTTLPHPFFGWGASPYPTHTRRIRRLDPHPSIFRPKYILEPSLASAGI